MDDGNTTNGQTGGKKNDSNYDGNCTAHHCLSGTYEITCRWIFVRLSVPKILDSSGKRKWRICVDFRKLNDTTVGDSFPLPNILDILDKLGRARYFLHWTVQVGIGKCRWQRNRAKTAFRTPTGHCEYLQMPFGLKSAHSTLQSLMKCIYGFNWNQVLCLLRYYFCRNSPRTSSEAS